MHDDEKEAYTEQLIVHLNACISALPEIIRLAISRIPREHRKVNVVATLLVAAAKTVLASHGFEEDKQIAFIKVAAESMVYHPEVDGTGVVRVGGNRSPN